MTLGMAALNVRLQAALNPPSPEKKERRFGETVFREGDRVMQIRNDYDIVLQKSGRYDRRNGRLSTATSVMITAIDPQTETLAVAATTAETRDLRLRDAQRAASTPAP